MKGHYLCLGLQVSPVDRPLFTQGPVFPEFIYVTFPIPWFRASLPLVSEHLPRVTRRCSILATTLRRETTLAALKAARTGPRYSPATECSQTYAYDPDRHTKKNDPSTKSNPVGDLLKFHAKDAIVNHLPMNFELSFGYFWDERFSLTLTPDTRRIFP